MALLYLDVDIVIHINTLLLSFVFPCTHKEASVCSPRVPSHHLDALMYRLELSNKELEAHEHSGYFGMCCSP